LKKYVILIKTNLIYKEVNSVKESELINNMLNKSKEAFTLAIEFIINQQ